MATSKVLIVEDNYPTARAVMYVLTRAGYACRMAQDGLEALERIAEDKPDLIVLDLQMPRMNGLEVCRRLHCDPRYDDIYVIVLTALGDEADIARAHEAGADECLGKPLDPPKLLKRVDEALRLAGTR